MDIVYIKFTDYPFRKGDIIVTSSTGNEGRVLGVIKDNLFKKIKRYFGFKTPYIGMTKIRKV